ncbi:hypothetical protein [Segetibacter koreensis]|uniref:hypothetical protein n=1 Tax=Segetibacter koreensis TaxID=398037 RepID=UPI000377960A|nr:hypothetical protein [Segetibacter koreensis]
MENHLLLKKPINELPLTEEFKRTAEINGFENLEEILSFSAVSWLQREGVTYHLYKELADYLQENNLLHLLQHQY